MTVMRCAPSIDHLRGRRSQRGSFLLEALVGIAIISFGILGIVGLQAQSIRWVNDAQYRSEAIYLANAAISRMWADNPANLKAEYDKTANGAGYQALKEAVKVLPNADLADYAPIVTVDPGPANNSSLVSVTIRWRLPGETKGGFDDKGGSQYVTSAVIGSN
ncbi:MAG: type pilus modification protein PilV [Acidobacteria bacterium]|nr:type pilus modification protein PilV [Acidobacteriota bacterium]